MDPLAVQEALGARGSFLKKRVLQEIYDNIPGLLVFDEEVGVRFGETRASDMVCFQSAPEGNAFYVMDCHRAPTEAAWIFLRHIGPQYREMRVLYRCELLADLTETPATSDVVCSEGYEAREDEKGHLTLEPAAIVNAANQLSGAYLGFIKWVQQRRIKCKVAFVPILVTTARLRIADFPWNEVDLASGNLQQSLKMKEVDWVILKHPFPTPAQVEDDFHMVAEEMSSPQLTAESIYIVQADSLKNFLSSERLAHFESLLES